MNNCGNCKFWRKIRDEDLQIDEKHTWKGPHGECCRIDEYSHTTSDWTTINGTRHYDPLAKAWLSLCPIYIDNGRDWEPVENQDRYSTESSLITKPDFYCNEFKLKE